jgi:hypothetical protein
MKMRVIVLPLFGTFLMVLAVAMTSSLAQVERPTVQAPPPTGEPPAPEEWSALAELPDWTGVWISDWLDQIRQENLNDVPWNEATAAEVERQIELQNQGFPRGSHNTCLPWGMPGFMMHTHNAIEFLFTPGRITILGELDGNNLRRIYTDGRPHPDRLDIDPTMHGHSIGHWEGDTLVVDTIYVMPQTEIALSEGVGVPNGGDMHIIERIHLLSPNILADDMEIHAPHILKEPYKTRRMFFRRGWGPEWDIVESICLEGNFVDQIDENGYAIFVPIHPDDQ